MKYLSTVLTMMLLLIVSCTEPNEKDDLNDFQKEEELPINDITPPRIP